MTRRERSPDEIAVDAWRWRVSWVVTFIVITFGGVFWLIVVGFANSDTARFLLWFDVIPPVLAFAAFMFASYMAGTCSVVLYMCFEILETALGFAEIGIRASKLAKCNPEQACSKWPESNFAGTGMAIVVILTALHIVAFSLAICWLRAVRRRGGFAGRGRANQFSHAETRGSAHRGSGDLEDGGVRSNRQPKRGASGPNRGSGHEHNAGDTDRSAELAAVRSSLQSMYTTVGNAKSKSRR